jgi:protein-S-isoprenylcysteine O-methyltransferase Ste14
MSVYNIIIAILWLSFWIYWIISARGRKKVIERAYSGPRGVFVIFVILLLSLSKFPFFHTEQFFSNQIILSVGLIFCALGLGFAVWARRHLGNNWNGEPSIQEHHELVTSGPYHYVRHPIYSGMLLALTGSTLLGSLVWLITLIASFAILIMRIKIEEDFMIKIFPDQYSEYKKHTKALIPFIW